MILQERLPKRSVMPYWRGFDPPLKTGTGSLEGRSGWILREVLDGAVSWGEVAPLPGFSNDADDVEAAIFRWQSGLGAGILGERGALGFAGWCLDQTLPFSVAVPSATLVQGNSGSDFQWVSGSTVKVKIGIRGGEEERKFLDALMTPAPASMKLRLDANQTMDLKTTAEWLGWMRERPQVEFLEQPMAVGSERLLMDTFSRDLDRLALDESVVSLSNLENALALGWEGWLVIKPSLFGSPEPLFSLPESVRRKIVISSAFETGVGFSFVLEVARRLGDFGIAHGIGTRGAFGEDGLDGWGPSMRFEGTVTSDFLEGVAKNAS